jgi:hypothetical protein
MVQQKARRVTGGLFLFFRRKTALSHAGGHKPGTLLDRCMGIHLVVML